MPKGRDHKTDAHKSVSGAHARCHRQGDLPPGELQRPSLQNLELTRCLLELREFRSLLWTGRTDPSGFLILIAPIEATPKTEDLGNMFDGLDRHSGREAVLALREYLPVWVFKQLCRKNRNRCKSGASRHPYLRVVLGGEMLGQAKLEVRRASPGQRNQN